MSQPVLSLEYRLPEKDHEMQDISVEVVVDGVPNEDWEKSEGSISIPMHEDDDLKVLEVRKSEQKKEKTPYKKKKKYESWLGLDSNVIFFKSKNSRFCFRNPVCTDWSFSESIFGDPFEKDPRDKPADNFLKRGYKYKYRNLLSDDISDVLDNFALWLQDSEPADLKKCGFRARDNCSAWLKYDSLKELMSKSEFISSEV